MGNFKKTVRERMAVTGESWQTTQRHVKAEHEPGRDFVYLASPYTHADPTVKKSRFIEITKAASHLIREGHMVFSPITHFHPMELHGGLPDGWEFWKTIDELYLKHSKTMFILGLSGWEDSVGVAAEIKICKRMGLPISLVDPVTYQIKGV